MLARSILELCYASKNKVTVDNCGHIPQKEFPEETVKHLSIFFAGEQT